jgi:hypothetical protein
MIPDNLKFSVLINKEKYWPARDKGRAVHGFMGVSCWSENMHRRLLPEASCPAIQMRLPHRGLCAVGSLACVEHRDATARRRFFCFRLVAN